MSPPPATTTWSADELIAAPATPDGPGARAIVRLAGDGLATLLGALVEADDGVRLTPDPAPARVVTARLAGALAVAWGRVPVGILYWPGPAGPIGGPLAEVHLPCSAPLVDAVMAEACRRGARLARGGEFTLRAFLTGRLDVVQAEAVLAVVEASSPAELAAALDRMAGGAGAILRRLRDDLLDVLADVEASIDFADETTPDATPGIGATAWRSLADRIDRTLAGVRDARATLQARGVAGAELPRVVLFGPPNIGKSSLFNTLAGRDAALVADAAGTTRDMLEVRMEFIHPDAGAVACVLVDVAGMTEGDGAVATVTRADHVDRTGRVDAPECSDPVAEAERIARRAVADADVIVVCRDAGTGVGHRQEPGDRRQRIDVLTRCDRVVSGRDGVATGPAPSAIATSSVTGGGMASLSAAIAVAVSRLPRRGSPATVRLAAGLDAAAHELRAAGDMVAADPSAIGLDAALLAGHLRTAIGSLDDVTGFDLGPDLLDRIFSRHCIGK